MAAMELSELKFPSEPGFHSHTSTKAQGIACRPLYGNGTGNQGQIFEAGEAMESGGAVWLRECVALQLPPFVLTY
jgi:hypothetical protein